MRTNAFFIQEGETNMSDNPVQGETPAKAGETPAETTATEPFDLARAMATIDKLRSENRELSKVQKRLADMEAAAAAKQQAEMTELEKVKAKAAELETKLKQAELQRMRFEAAQKVGIPAQLAARLQGETPEELEADAKAILELLPKQPTKPTTPTISPTNPGGAGTGETLEQQGNRIHGIVNSNPWDPDFFVKLGGGVRQVKTKGDNTVS